MMIERLQKIQISDDLIEIVAISQFYECNACAWTDQSTYCKFTWLKGAEESINDYNDMVDTFQRIGFHCGIDPR